MWVEYMTTFKQVAINIGFLALSVILSLIATNVYFQVYTLCAGGSAGIAFGLTFAGVPIGAGLIFISGIFVGKVTRNRTPKRAVWFRVGAMVIATLLIVGALLLQLYPYPKDQNFGTCPSWMMRNLKVT
jgi:hypothetical protein